MREKERERERERERELIFRRPAQVMIEMASISSGLPPPYRLNMQNNNNNDNNRYMVNLVISLEFN